MRSRAKTLNTNNLQRRQNTSIESEITVGTKVIVKVGRNEVEVTVTEITGHGWKVKSQSTGREFEVRRIERIVAETAAKEEAEPETAPVAAEPEDEDNAVNPTPGDEALAPQRRGAGACRLPRPDELQGDRRQGGGDGALDAHRREDPGADALQRHLPRDQDHRGTALQEERDPQGFLRIRQISGSEASIVS